MSSSGIEGLKVDGCERSFREEIVLYERETRQRSHGESKQKLDPYSIDELSHQPSIGK